MRRDRAISVQANPATIRILVADDQYLIREGIASLLELEDTLEVVDMAANGKEATKKAPRAKTRHYFDGHTHARDGWD